MTRAKRLRDRFESLIGRKPAAKGGGGKEAPHEPTDGEKLRKIRRRFKEQSREMERLRTQQVRGLLDLSTIPTFFIVGRVKSGTSWLMKILDAHPEILCKGEGRFFGRDFIQEDFERGQQGRIQPSSLYRALLEAEYLEAWIERSVWTRGDDVQEHLTNLTRLSASYFLAQRLAKSGKKIVGDKTPLSSNAIVEEISTIYPGAKVIHIIRDGRDAAVSLVHHRWNHADLYELKPEELAKRQAYRENHGMLATGEGMFTEGTLRNLAIRWKELVNKSSEDGRRLLGANYAELKYEDLLERPEEEIRRLLDFLGADAEEKTVKDCIKAASFEALSSGRQRGEEDSTSFFRKGVAGDWRRVFTEEDRKIFKEEAGELLIELGYEKDYSW